MQMTCSCRRSIKPRLTLIMRAGRPYICGNPPYQRQSKRQNKEQKEDLKRKYSTSTEFHRSWKSLDYVGRLVHEGSRIRRNIQKPNQPPCESTNSVCQGQKCSELCGLQSLRPGHKFISALHTYLVQMGEFGQPQCRRHRCDCRACRICRRFEHASRIFDSMTKVGKRFPVWSKTVENTNT